MLGTPISEAAFTGLGGGLALDGRYYPVVELMYADFIWVAADQIFNQIGKARHMFGGGHDMPLLMRIKIGIGTGYGSQHSMDPAGILATSVGWRIIAPSTPLDYVGLVNAAMTLRTRWPCSSTTPTCTSHRARRPVQDSTTSCRPARPRSGGRGRPSR